MEHMEEQDIKEAKRARNFIWMAACDYDIEPLFLAFAPDGSADIYLNLIIGLEYKWYEHDKIDDLFNHLESLRLPPVSSSNFIRWAVCPYAGILKPSTWKSS